MRVRYPFFITAALLFGACGDDNASEPTTPSDPPQLAIGTIDTVPTSAISANGALPSPLPLPCGGSVVVALSVTNFELRAPGSCGATRNCGHVLVSATEVAQGSSVSARAITTRAFLALAPEASFEGTVRFDARLVRDDGSPFATPDGRAITAEPALANFSVSADACAPPPSEGGAGGAPSGAGGEGGMDTAPGGAGGAAGADTSPGGAGDGGSSMAEEGGAVGESGAGGAADAGASGMSGAGAGGAP